ncbi:MAG TPA: Na-translocating system protein MpsC family protein [Solirubrobacteraceae bacterium]|nr:Na-translocating system protein MpsC family protein [Solirubrobacteraceae bacterium]
MPAPDASLTGDQTLAAVTEAMVAFHQRYHHRKPVTAKTLMLGDDLLACVLGGVYTDVEKTMIEIQRKTIVQETRNEFQNAMQDKFINAVERLTGRIVLTFISNHHVGPDIEIELFLLSADGTSDNRVPVVRSPDST